MSGKVPEPTEQVQQTAALFDDLVGAQEKGLGNSQPDRLRGLQIHDEIEFCWLLDRQIRRFATLQKCQDPP